ncbi:hypothetical protein DB346_22950 [Verrucomicrobia bacterium LW23]|nr:hypothetical protein DB346_22950 [Verrucomicrobia bacterium LW23]
MKHPSFPIPGPIRRAAVLAMAVAVALLLAGAEMARAQGIFENMGSGQSISGFYYPFNGPNGVLVQEIRGSRATKASTKRVDVWDLDLRLYDRNTGKLATILKMPLANFYVQEQKLSTSQGVLIQYPTREIRADSIDWMLKTKTGVLKKNVKVILHDFDFGASNQPLAPGASPGDAAPPGNGTQGNTLPLPSATLPTGAGDMPPQPQAVDWSAQPQQPEAAPAQQTPAPEPTHKPGDIIIVPPTSTP